MSEKVPASLPSIDLSLVRRDIKLASLFTVVGIVAIIASGAGIRAMIAGSVGSVGGGCVAVGLTLLDPRLSYTQRAQASLPIIAMLAGIGFTLKENVWALAGYPVLVLGIAGLVPSLLRYAKALPDSTPAQENRSPALSARAAAVSN